MWSRLFSVTFLALILAACSPGSIQTPSFSGFGNDPGRNCADLFARFYTTNGTQHGIWDCLSPRLQQQFESSGKKGDAAIAGPADVHHNKYVAHDLHTSGGDSYVYRVWEEDSNHEPKVLGYLVVFTDSKGRIVKFSIAA